MAHLTGWARRMALVLLALGAAALMGCDTGLADGSDLVGTWKDGGYDALFYNTSASFIFNADGTGLWDEYVPEGSMIGGALYSISWRVIAAEPYRIIELDFPDKPSRAGQYEYYFFDQKRSIHLTPLNKEQYGFTLTKE